MGLNGCRGRQVRGSMGAEVDRCGARWCRGRQVRGTHIRRRTYNCRALHVCMWLDGIGLKTLGLAQYSGTPLGRPPLGTCERWSFKRGGL